MSKRIREHLRSNVVGYVAIFLFAIGGTAYATHPGGSNTISTGDIINSEVKTADIGDGEVRQPDLGADAVASGKIQDRQVKNADLSIGASSSNTIADGGIQAVDVQNNTLTGGQIDEASLDPSSFFAAANAGTGGAICTADFGPAECASTNINLPRDSRLMIVASGQWFVFNFTGGASDDVATGGCEIQVDDVSTDSSHAMGERRTAAGANSWTQRPAEGFARGTVALTHMTGVLAAGTHKLDVTCSQADADIDWANVRLVAARVG